MTQVLDFSTDPVTEDTIEVKGRSNKKYTGVQSGPDSLLLLPIYYYCRNISWVLLAIE